MYHITWNIEIHLYARKCFSRLKVNDASLKDLQSQSGVSLQKDLYVAFFREESTIELCDYTK